MKVNKIGTSYKETKKFKLSWYINRLSKNYITLKQ